MIPFKISKILNKFKQNLKSVLNKTMYILYLFLSSSKSCNSWMRWLVPGISTIFEAEAGGSLEAWAMYKTLSLKKINTKKLAGHGGARL